MSKIVAQEKHNFHLQHSDQIKRHQRRRYSRKKIRLPVFLNFVNGQSGAFALDLIDLSAGGASLRNPGKHLQPGNYVELSFAPQDEQFHVAARVVRVSQGGNLAHVVFESLDQGLRDRIAHSLL